MKYKIFNIYFYDGEEKERNWRCFARTNFGGFLKDPKKKEELDIVLKKLHDYSITTSSMTNTDFLKIKYIAGRGVNVKILPAPTANPSIPLIYIQFSGFQPPAKRPQTPRKPPLFAEGWGLPSAIQK